MRKSLSNAASLPQFGWSADSKTIAWVTLKSLSVSDAASAMFQYEMLSSSAMSYSWAPAGDHLLYTDATGSYVAQVDSGVVSHKQPFAAGALTAWSPDGKYLLTSVKGNLTLTDVTSGAAVTTVITKPTIAAPNVTAGHVQR